MLISPDIVLTAAHCLDEKSEASLRVVFEHLDTGQIEKASVQKFQKFKNDDRQLAPNFDIAWVKLVSPAPVNFYQTEIFPSQDLKSNESVILAGFGKTSTNCEPGNLACSGTIILPKTWHLNCNYLIDDD